MRRLPILLAAALTLAACEAQIGTNADAPEQSPMADGETAQVEGKAADGQFSIDAPGFDMKVAIPEGLANRVNFSGDGQILYPGAELAGMHVEGRNQGGGVDLKFTSGDSLATVLAWYRDPARADGFTIGSARRDGAAYVLDGTQKSDGDRFTLRLAERSGGGTQGDLSLADTQG